MQGYGVRKIARLLVLISLAAHACEAAEAVIDIYQLALQRDATFRAAQANHLAAREAKPQARSFLLPQLDLTASYSISGESTTGSFVAGEFTQPVDRSATPEAKSYALNLNQVLFNRDLFIGLDQADASIAQAEAELASAQQDLIVRTAQAYFNVLAAQDTLRFTIAEKEAIGRQLEQAEKRFEVGLIAITDVKEAQADYDAAVAAEIAARNSLDISREELQVITGNYHEALSKLSERMPLIAPEPEDIDQWVSQSLEKNLAIVAAEFAAEVARLQIKRQRAGHYPTLGLNASASRSEVDGATSGDRDTDGLELAFQLDLPIYTGGLTSSQVREARHLFEQAQDQLTLQRRDAVRQARASYLNVMSGISRVKALQRAVESNQAAAQATQAGFDVGTRTSVDVLVTLRNVFQAERDYAVARYDYLVDTLRLKQAAGILAVDDVETINQWLD